MKIREIWKQFGDTLKESAVQCWMEIKKVAKSTFELLKVALIDFVKAIYEWLYTLIEGVFVIVFGLIKVAGSALLAAIKSTLGILLGKIIEWIKKL